MKCWTDFHVALTFLTPLGRARITDNAAISRSMAMYPLVGGVIGVCLALAALLPVSSSVLAWGLVFLNIILTRGLHWDGWADLWDGWGSGQHGQRFWEIVKDSRIGAFGVMGLILGIGAQGALFGQAIDGRNVAVLIFAPIFGRLCCLTLARLGRNLARPGLGMNAIQGADRRALLIGMGTTALLLPAIPLLHLAGSLLLAAPAIWFLLRLAGRQNGINGDFLGTAIVAGEICALLPLACTYFT